MINGCWNKCTDVGPKTRYLRSCQVKWSEVKVTQSHPTLWPHGLYSTWNYPGQNTGVGSLSLLQRIFPTQGSNPGLQYCRPILYQPSDKGSLSLLQRIFLTQESNWGFLHCRRILYQLSYQGSPAARYLPQNNLLDTKECHLNQVIKPNITIMDQGHITTASLQKKYITWI